MCVTRYMWNVHATVNEKKKNLRAELKLCSRVSTRWWWVQFTFMAQPLRGVIGGLHSPRAAFESPSSCSNRPRCIQTAHVVFIVLGLVALVVAVTAVLGHTHLVDVLYGFFMGCMWAIRVVDGL